MLKVFAFPVSIVDELWGRLSSQSLVVVKVQCAYGDMPDMSREWFFGIEEGEAARRTS
jgi:hypothetical protein